MFATIDLGSNSFHLLIAEFTDDGFKQHARFSRKVQLAENLSETGVLSEAAMQRGRDCLEDLVKQMKKHEVLRYKAVGTFALRVASNAELFLQDAQRILNIPVQVLSGNEEASLIYQGLQKSQRLDQKVLVIDIGGGSTEFAVGQGAQTEYLVSESIGCVTLRDQFFAEDDLSQEAFDAASAYARDWAEASLSDVKAQQWQQAWGTSGTMKAVARIMDGVYRCGYRIERGQLASVLADMLQQDDVRKLQYKGLNDDRRRLIMPGLAIISALMSVLDIEVLDVGTASLREGVLWSMQDS